MGGWKDPDNSAGFNSALYTVHEIAHGRVGQYVDPCPQCRTLWTDNRGGCESHANSPQPVRSGSVCSSTLMKNTIQWIHKRSNHKTNGSAQLLPKQVRQLGVHCVSGNDPCDFAIYVLLLVAINLFLRKLEFSSLKESNFNVDMFVMTGEYIVSALHLKVLGKGVRDTTRGEFFYQTGAGAPFSITNGSRSLCHDSITWPQFRHTFVSQG